MMELPSAHAAGAIALTAAMFYGFVSGRARVEIISLLTLGAIALGLYFFPLPGESQTDGMRLAFSGFDHYALITPVARDGDEHTSSATTRGPGCRWCQS